MQETAEKKLSLIALGHIASEKWGAKFMADWLENKFPEIKVNLLKTG
ncbi:hypothetical protein [Pedobacter mendelii]